MLSIPLSDLEQWLNLGLPPPRQYKILRGQSFSVLLIEAVLLCINCLKTLWDKERGRMWPEQPLRNPIFHYCAQSFPYIILTMPTQHPLTGPQGIRAKQYGQQKKPTSPSKHLMKSLTQWAQVFRTHTWHEGNTEGAITTARHTLHNKSKASSCGTRLAIPTKGSGTQRCTEA